jgi:uncharacterized membrane protein YkvA (DUF1232 family)
MSERVARPLRQVTRIEREHSLPLHEKGGIDMHAQRTPRKPTYDELQVQNMISEGGRIDGSIDGGSNGSRANDNSRAHGDDAPRLDSNVTMEGSWLRTKIEDVSAKLGRRFLSTLGKRKGRLSDSLERVPQGMHKVANQTALVLELIDDFKDGTYREVPWHSVALASAGVLYAVNPADLVPNFLPIVGVFDDMAVIAIATRWIEKDLVAYCRFKGYDVGEYFEDRS